jgi:hypothetical protein
MKGGWLKFSVACFDCEFTDLISKCPAFEHLIGHGQTDALSLLEDILFHDEEYVINSLCSNRTLVYAKKKINSTRGNAEGSSEVHFLATDNRIEP